MKRFCLLSLLILAAFISAFSLTIYVSPSGKDTNPGTLKSPLESLSAAIEKARTLRKAQSAEEPIEIIMAPGIYPVKQALRFIPEDGGTAASPLIIKGEPGKPLPVISGAVKLPRFEKIRTDLWRIRLKDLSPYGGAIQQLFVNGRRAVRARTPNYDSYYQTKGTQESPDSVKDSNAIQKIFLTAAQLKALAGIDEAGLQQVIISVNHAWDRTRKYIDAKDLSDTSVSFKAYPAPKWNRLSNSSQFIFENARAFLDSAGEWFCDRSGDLYYIPLKNEKIETATAMVPVTEQLIVISGDAGRKVENIRFEGLTFQYTRYLMPASGENPAQAAAPTNAAVMIDYAGNISFKNCEIQHTANNAIWLRAACTSSRIEHCYLNDLGMGGIKIGEMKIPQNPSDLTSNITIDNNIIHSGGHEIPTGVGILIFHAADNAITHNDIADFRYSGISVGWMWGYSYSPSKRNRIMFNHIHHLGWGILSDMGGIYTLGASEGTVAANNHIHDIYSYGYGGWGLYTDEGSAGIIMENNLVYRCKSSGFHQHYGKDNIIHNNIFALNRRAQLQATRPENHRSFSFTNNIVYFNDAPLTDKSGWEKVKFYADSNCYWNASSTGTRFGDKSFKQWQDSTGKDLHSIIVDPGFIDPSSGNFRFKNNTALTPINFKPFDYDSAGVYGTPSWRTKAKLPAAIINAFDRQVLFYEKEQAK
jgi:hypothetical protein